MMFRVGLTGSIGMGKSTTAAIFAQLGVPVHDSDQVVHQLYKNPDVVQQIEDLFEGTTDEGAVNRPALGKVVLNNPSAMKRLEALVHPLVREAETDFMAQSEKTGAPYAIVDIPLLFETDQSDRFDCIIVVTASAETQRKRVLARPGMTEKKFNSILAKQMPDEDKRARATFIVDTQSGIDNARTQVAAIHKALCQRAKGG